MKTNLYNIETEYLTLMSQIEEAEGELTPEMEEALTINKGQLEGKSIAYLHIITTKEALNSAIDIEIKRLTALKKSNSNLIARLKDRLLQAVNLFGAFEVGINKFGTRKSSSVEVEDVNALPTDYKVLKVTETANKPLIKLAIKEGLTVKGCSIVEKLNLKIN